MPRTVVLFDLDGTLTDPFDGITACVQHALATLGRPSLDATTLRRFIGPPLQDSFVEFCVMGPAEAERAVSAYRDRFATHGMFDNHVYDGIPAALASLQRSGAQLAVATSKPTLFARRIVDHFGLGEHFTTVVGAELDGSRRHKHEVIAAALEDLEVDANHVWMVGDRAHDVTGAALLGIPTMGVLWGYGTADELTTVGARVLVETPRDLPAALHAAVTI